jgi:hypothetical protein
MNKLILRSRAKKASRQVFPMRSTVPCREAGSGMPQWAVLGWPGHIWANLFGGVVTNRENKIGSGSFRTKLLPALAAEAPGGDVRSRVARAQRHAQFLMDGSLHCVRQSGIERDG